MRNAHYAKWVLLIAAASVLVSSQARAAVVATVITQGSNPKDNVGDSSSGFTAYIIRIATDNGSVITGVDAGGGLTNATNGIFGPILQNWDITRSGETPTPVKSDEFTPLGPYSVDSHFLVPDASRVDVDAPSEDNSGVNPPGSPPDFPGNGGSDFGAGTFLQGTFGIQAGQATSMDLAYIVLQNGQLATFSMDIATSDNNSFHVAGVIPEPASAGLFSVGLGMLFGIRRRPVQLN
jgi:hypothetical protein